MNKTYNNLTVPIFKTTEGFVGLMEYGVDVVDFIKKLQAKDKKFTKETYGEFFIKALKLLTLPGDNSGFSVLCKHGVLGDFIELCNKYLQVGEDANFKDMIKKLIKQLKLANKVSVLAVTDSPNGLGDGKDKRSLDSPTYNYLALDGDSWAVIPKDKFKGYKHLETLSIGPKVKTIKTGAFSDCKQLRKITIERRSNPITIEDDAFVGCSVKTIKCSSEGVAHNIGKFFPKATIRTI